MELRDGVPASLRTIVVVPTLLTTRAELEEQIERLEVHYLASQDGDLRFALLSDWTDCATQNAPDDDELLGAAAEGIARLNRRHGPAPEGARFFLLHRRRIWNEGQGKWIGWERKRGKLHELNRLLRGATDTTFVAIDGCSPIVPSGVRYVITLDADTRLPRGTAKRLIGKMAHPLNRPRLDPDSGRVVEGYAVLQPRVTPSLPSGREGSLFQRIFTSPSGLDPYAFAVSDVYQDLFGEGSYSGKGIYDVDAFEAALDGRLPESIILSHDLLEGIFARAGLVSDIEVVEEFPSRYDVAAARQHRWARGDWQLLPWIFGRGRDSSGDQRPNRDSLDRPLEDAGQPAADAVGAGRVPRVAGGMDAALACRRGLERVRSRDVRDSHPFAGFHRDGAAKARALAAQALARGRRRFRPCAVAGRASGHTPCASGVVDDRRHRANLLSSIREASAVARVGNRRSGEGSAPSSISADTIGGWPAASRSLGRPSS